MKTKISLLLFVATALGLFFVVNGFDTSARQSYVEVESTAPQIPEHVLYESLFRMDLSFRRKALEQETKGQQENSLNTYFKDNFGLSDEEDETLRRISEEFYQDIQPIDAQAAQIIDNLRSQFPYNEIGEGQQVPPPPQALADLQSQRNSIVLGKRDKLAQALGSARFTDLDSYVKQDFAANFQAFGSPRQ